MKWLPACAAVIVLVTLGSAVSPAVPGTARRCNIQSPRVTAAIIDGDLWGMIQSQRGRYLFTWSGDPVLDLEEAAHLTRMLGFSGSDVEMARFLLNHPAVVGGDSVEDYFYLVCPGAYRLTAVVRRDPSVPTGGVTPTRIWLHQQRAARVLRSFCMKPQVLPPGARISVALTVPLRATPPRWEIDRDGDGMFERSGTFRRGGAGFPSSNVRC